MTPPTTPPIATTGNAYNNTYPHSPALLSPAQHTAEIDPPVVSIPYAMPFTRDFRFACPSRPLYTPEGRPAPETLVRHSIVPLQRPSAQPVVTCGRLEALCSRHFSDTAPHVGHFFANRTALPVPRVSLPAPAAPRSAATCRRTAAGLDVLPPAGASSTWHASRAGPRSSPAAAGDS